MHAEFVIGNNGKRLFERLPQLFGARDSAALARSRLGQQLKSLDNPRYWACEERPNYRLSAWWSSRDTFRLIIEPLGQLDLRQACQELWDELRAEKDLKPRLTSLTVEGDIVKRPVATADQGVMSSTRQPEILLNLAAGLASALWLAVASLLVFEPSADLVLGAVPAIVIAIAAGVYSYVDARRGKLVWS